MLKNEFLIKKIHPGIIGWNAGHTPLQNPPIRTVPLAMSLSYNLGGLTCPSTLSLPLALPLRTEKVPYIINKV